MLPRMKLLRLLTLAMGLTGALASVALSIYALAAWVAAVGDGATLRGTVPEMTLVVLSVILLMIASVPLFAIIASNQPAPSSALLTETRQTALLAEMISALAAAGGKPKFATGGLIKRPPRSLALDVTARTIEMLRPDDADSLRPHSIRVAYPVSVDSDGNVAVSAVATGETTDGRVLWETSRDYAGKTAVADMLADIGARPDPNESRAARAAGPLV